MLLNYGLLKSGVVTNNVGIFRSGGSYYTICSSIVTSTSFFTNFFEINHRREREYIKTATYTSDFTLSPIYYSGHC